MTDDIDPYLYPKSGVLRNKLGLRSVAKLDFHERELVTLRIRAGIPTGDFDLPHLKAIHRHLFQDVYDWAGEVRTVEINKNGNQFQFVRYIETGMADVHRQLTAASFLRKLKRQAFVVEAGVIIGDINHVHPFREGNGRTQLQYLKLLAAEAGHPLDLANLSQATWIAPSRAAHNGEYTPMAKAIDAALI